MPARRAGAGDLAQFGIGEPLLLRSGIDSAADLVALAKGCRSILAALAELRDNGVAARHVGTVRTALIEAALRRALAIRADPALGSVRHSWLVLGSLARREPLPTSDLDTALIWADPPPASVDPSETMRAAAARILDDIRHCGLTPCPSGTGADNRRFGRSQSAWAAWLHDPGDDEAVLLSAMVADSRPVTDIALGAPTTYVSPHELDSLTRRHLRETLRAIAVVQRRVDEFWLRRLEP